MILYEYAVVNDGQRTGLRHFFIRVEAWLFKRNVVALPFARSATNVSRRWILAVDGGSLHESWRQQPGTPCYGADLPADKLREHFTSLGTRRTAAQHAEYLANHAKQEQALAAQGNNLK